MKVTPFSEFQSASIAELRKKFKRRQQLVKAQGDKKIDLIKAEIRNKQESIQRHMSAVDGDVDLEIIVNELDGIALLERRQRQFEKLLDDLFPLKTDESQQIDDAAPKVDG